MERATGGELFDAIVDAGHFDEPRAMEVMRQLLGVLDFMHGRGVIHRDVKPENILLASRDPEDWTIKVSDFGLVKLLGDPATGLVGKDVWASLAGPSPCASATAADLGFSLGGSLGELPRLPEGGMTAAMARTFTTCGSAFYMAPEVTWAHLAAGDGYGPGCDVWSAGVVLYILLSGNTPWGQAWQCIAHHSMA